MDKIQLKTNENQLKADIEKSIAKVYREKLEKSNNNILARQNKIDEILSKMRRKNSDENEQETTINQLLLEKERQNILYHQRFHALASSSKSYINALEMKMNATEQEDADAEDRRVQEMESHINALEVKLITTEQKEAIVEQKADQERAVLKTLLAEARESIEVKSRERARAEEESKNAQARAQASVEEAKIEYEHLKAAAEAKAKALVEKAQAVAEERIAEANQATVMAQISANEAEVESKIAIARADASIIDAKSMEARAEAFVRNAQALIAEKVEKANKPTIIAQVAADKPQVSADKPQVSADKTGAKHVSNYHPIIPKKEEVVINEAVEAAIGDYEKMLAIIQCTIVLIFAHLCGMLGRSIELLLAKVKSLPSIIAILCILFYHWILYSLILYNYNPKMHIPC